ncbi:MAG: hypothetical protein IH624_13330 [Phycisphaerae bacterium]|nr:hypothetical protein [Phycisphaerae bacterium]
MRTRTYALLALMAILAAGAQAAFLVEAHDSGVASDNFDGTTTRQSIPSKAPGLSIWGTATSSVFGASDTDNDWTYFYTPLIDADNFLSAAGFDLTNGHVSSGLVGGLPGLYNVYITWPPSDNPPVEGCNITVTSDGDDNLIEAVNQRTGGTGTPGGNSGWYKIGDRVHLTTGRTYTVNQVANVPGNFPSMRSHGVLWELVEPDVPVAEIVESDGVTSVEEGGETDQYTIVLKEQPPTTIIITTDVSEPNQIKLNGAESLELTFTPQNWNIPQVVHVSAEQDATAEPEKSVWVLHITQVADANLVEWHDAYAGMVTVYVRDYAVPGVKIRETDGLTEVSEQGGADSYTLELLFPPTDKVTVTITTDGQTLVDTGAGAAGTSQLVFTSANWNEAQTVIVSAVDDAVLEGDHTSVITHAVASLDGGYDGLTVRKITVHVEDNECGAWGYLPLDLNQDCVINIADLAEFAASWLECTQPYGDSCQDVR